MFRDVKSAMCLYIILKVHMSINALVSNLWIAILMSLLATVCNLQDVSRDYDHGELMALFLPVKTAK